MRGKAAPGDGGATVVWPRLWERRGALILYLLALLPPLVLGAAVHRNAVDVPFMDDWQFVSLVEKVHGGEIPWREFVAPHDEHRLLIPRIVIVSSLILSHGNYRVQCFVSVGVMAALSLSLVFLLRRTLGPGRATPLAWLLANLVLFSPMQWHNWLWPMQFAYFLPFAFLGLALAVWFSELPPAARFALCLACAWAASFSFVSGLLLWPVLLLAILHDERWRSSGARWTHGALWLAMGLLATFLYAHGLWENPVEPAYAYGHVGEPPTSSTLRMLRQDPLPTLGRMFAFACAMFGNAISRGFPVPDNIRFSSVCGFLLLAGAVALCVALSRRGRLSGAAYAWVVLLVYAFATAALVSLGRVWLGRSQPMTPRYVTYGSFCLLAVVVLACLAFAASRATATSRDLWFLALGIVGSALAVNWVYGLNLMGEWRDVRMASRTAVHFSQRLYAPFLYWAGGRRAFVRDAINRLDRLGYWHPPLASSLRLDQFKLTEEPLSQDLGHVLTSSTLPNGNLLVRGHARYGGGRTPHAILFTALDSTGVRVIRAACMVESPPHWQFHAFTQDYEFVSRPRKKSYGFYRCQVRPKAIPPGEPRELEPWALDFARWRVHRIAATLTLPEARAAP